MVDRSGTVIVALPEKDDYVNRISSEEKPHMTVLYLGDMTEEQQMQVALFLEHVAQTTLSRFGLSVDRRDTLGDDDADVLFFDGKWAIDRLKDIRHQLLQDDTIRQAFNSAEQFPEWIPHLTLGYPSAPAKEDNRDYPGIHWVNFDRLALWTGGFEGSEFRLKDDESMELAMSSFDSPEDFLAHYGVKGMKWGVRHQPVTKIEKKAFEKTDKNFKRALKVLNDHPKYKGVDINKAPAKVRKEYEADAEEVFTKLYQMNIDRGLQSQATKSKVRASILLGSAAAAIRFTLVYALAQASEGLEERVIRLKLILNDLGQIEDAEEVSDQMEHTLATDESIKSALDESSTLSDFLAHHGIKGMRWGVRRTDAQLAKAGAKPEAGAKKDDDDLFISADAERFVKTRQKAGHEMSDREIREALNRAKMVKEYNDMFSEDGNSELRSKVDSLRLQKEYSELKAEMTPDRLAAVKKLVGAAESGWTAFNKLDNATGGKMSGYLKDELGKAFDPSARPKRTKAVAKS